MPLLEVAGRLKVSPEQMGGTCVKVGVTLEFTVTVMVWGVAHSPILGVKV